MTTHVPVDRKTVSELSCREARLILRVTPLRLGAREMKPEALAGMRHYLYCKDCRDLGLAGILGTGLSCQEAILIWAEAAGALWLRCTPGLFVQAETLIETFAVEHVWGKYQWQNSIGGSSWDPTAGCRERPCQAVSAYWSGIPMSTGAGDGAVGVIELFPRLIEVFLMAGWPLNELLILQEKRVADLLRDLNSGTVTVSPGHYHSTDELAEEVRAHVMALQSLVLS